MAYTPITNLPTPPSRQEPATFSERGDAFLGALPTFGTQVNAAGDFIDGVGAQVTADTATASAAAASAELAKTIAQAAANYKGDYNAGTTYQIGESVSYEGKVYSAKTVNTGVTPADGANWLDITIAAIRTPEVISPDGITDSVIEPTLTASAYASLYSADARSVREFQLTTFADTGYATPVFTASVNADTVAVTPALDLVTQYRWRCRDVAVSGATSAYSTDAVFTTADVTVNAPTLTVEGSPTDVPETPTLTTGAFATAPTGLDTHASTNWIVRLAADDTIVYQSLADAVNLLSIVVPAGLLLVNTEYKFQVQHVGTTYGASAVTEVVATTLASFDIVPLLAVGHATTPFITIYNQEIDTFTKLADPATLPSGTPIGVAFSSDDTYMVAAHVTSPFITIYKRSGDTFTKLADPATLPASTGFCVAFSSDDTYMAVGHATTPFITIYKRSGDTFTKLADPATLPPYQPSAADGLSFSSDGTYLAAGHGLAPYITIYKRAGDTFTKLANPATLPASDGNGVDFSSDGTYLAVAHGGGDFLTIYKRSGDTFTKLAAPAVLPPSTGDSVAFSSDGTYLAVGHATNSPFIIIYKRSGDTFTKLADPDTPLPSTGLSLSFSSDSTYLAVGHSVSPFTTIYKRSGDTFTKLANPATLPTGNGQGVAFSNTGFPQ